MSAALDAPVVADDAFLGVVLSVGGAALLLAAAPPAAALLAARRSRQPHAATTLAGGPRLPAPPNFCEFTFTALRAELPPARGEPGGRIILHGASGKLAPGELCALVGPSGSGKSTLLNALAGEPPGGLRLSGCVRLDGVALARPARRAALGFVPQGDTHAEGLTARETVLFSAALRGHCAVARAGNDVDAALVELGLVRAAHTRVSSLSGGERRRVTIAAELVLSPPLLLLDEPTSGLDAFTALALLRTLAALAAPGRGVLAAVHAPSGEAFALFSRATLLACGHVLWTGAPAEAPAFLAASGVPCPPQRTAAEHLLYMAAAITDGGAQQLAPHVDPEAGAVATAPAEADEAPGAPHPPPGRVPLRRQLRLLLWRELLQASRAPALLLSHLLLSLGVAVWLGVVYYKLDNTIRGFQNRLGVAFFVCAYFGLSALSACDTLCGSRPLLRAQAHRFYHPAVFVATRLVVDALLLRLAPALTHACVLYFMIGFQRAPRRFFRFLAALLLHALAAAAQASALSAAAPSVAAANLACSFVFLQAAVFGGLLTNTAALPGWLAWLRFTSLEFYAFEAIVANEFSGLAFVLGIETIQGVEFGGDALLTSALSLNAEHIGGDLLCLLAWLLLFGTAAATITALRHK